MDITEIYESRVFSDSVMRARLPEKVYRSLKETSRMPGDRRRCGGDDEGLGHIAGGDAFFALVPAAFRTHGG